MAVFFGSPEIEVRLKPVEKKSFTRVYFIILNERNIYRDLDFERTFLLGTKNLARILSCRRQIFNLTPRYFGSIDCTYQREQYSEDLSERVLLNDNKLFPRQLQI